MEYIQLDITDISSECCLTFTPVLCPQFYICINTNGEVTLRQSSSEVTDELFNLQWQLWHCLAGETWVLTPGIAPHTRGVLAFVYTIYMCRKEKRSKLQWSCNCVWQPGEHIAVVTVCDRNTELSLTQRQK